ncbi:MAG: hypothetical protein JXA37_12345 [Chloroflexia bacterium]|nr:hypothetical protein [Chloroflexia bacterium]
MGQKKKRRLSPKRQWEQDLINDYADYRWHELLDPLYEQFQQWKAGRLEHWDLAQAIHEYYKENRERYKFFGQKRETLALWIQWDRPWFETWVAEHPPPPGVELCPPPFDWGEKDA